MGIIRNWLRRWRVKRAIWQESWFQAVLHRVPRLHALSVTEQDQLRALVKTFLVDKHFHGADGLTLDQSIKTKIATLACWPALKLGYGALEGWFDVIVYPGAFRARRTRRDEDTGVVHEYDQELAGEAWQAGPIVLSLEEIERDLSYPHLVQNVVIHEIAHKLDALDHAMDGMPPLHPHMRTRDWIEAFSAAYAALQRDIEAGESLAINRYAATNPQEFFAVSSEHFFLDPEPLKAAYPQVYQQLDAFYQRAGHA